MLEPIIVVDHDPSWPQTFKLLSKRIAKELGCIAAAIEHVGSTSVPGLPAKPIIDIDVLLSANHSLAEAIVCLQRMGYHHEGDLGIPGRAAFKALETDPPIICMSVSRGARSSVAISRFATTCVQTLLTQGPTES